MNVIALPSYALIVAAVFANSCATLFLRKASMAWSGLLPGFPYASTPTLLWGGIALGFYVASFALYALVLQRLPISLAYLIITSLTQLILLSYGLIILHEHLNVTAWVGVALTVSGLALIFAQTGR